MSACVPGAVQDYPCSSCAQPLLDIEGPLSTHDPARSALSQHLSAVAAEQQEELAGSGGYIWQLVGFILSTELTEKAKAPGLL